MGELVSQHFGAEPTALKMWREVEVLEPVAVVSWPYGDATDEAASRFDDPGVGRLEAVP